MAECYRCSREIGTEVIFCPYCGAKQRSSLVLFEKKEADEKPLSSPQQAPAKPETSETQPKPAQPTQASQPVQSSQLEPKGKLIINRQMILWTLFILVVAAFVYAVIQYWREFQSWLPT